jgi:putative tryptophan/tyrosine transport system substrate-binding protein
MRRREFIALAAAGAWPVPVRAQQLDLPVLGFLSGRAPDEAATHTAAFFRALADTGYLPGRNLAVEYRWAEGRYDRLPILAQDLTRRRVSFIAAVGGSNSALAAKAATSTTPIVFVIGDDPVPLGLVHSMNRPGSNATGVSLVTAALGGKRLEYICELTPGSGSVALLVNPANSNATEHASDARKAASSLGRHLVVTPASVETGFETAFKTLTDHHAVRALVVQNEPFFDSQRDQLIAMAARYALPAIYHIREFPAAGGLMSYGPSLLDAYYQAGLQAGRVLKGEKPAELPIVQPTKFELVINLKTASALGLTIPPTLLARADEVIE